MKKSFVNSCDCCLCPTCSSLSRATILPFFHLFQYHVLAVSFLRLERCQPNYAHCCSQYTGSCITSSEYSSKEYCCDLLFPSSKTISNFPEPALNKTHSVQVDIESIFTDITFPAVNAEPLFLPSCLLFDPSFACSVNS